MPKMSVRYKLFDSYDSYLYLYLYRELVNALKVLQCGSNKLKQRKQQQHERERESKKSDRKQA
jgi:hypothetical protein